MTSSSVTIQITPQSTPTPPSWLGEVAAFAQVLEHTGILKTIQEQVRFARARFGQYDLIDFVVVLLGYLHSGEPTVKAFDERLQPFDEPFMALFGRNQLPHRSTLSRFLAALDQSTMEALRMLFKVVRRETVRLTGGTQSEPLPLTPPARDVLTRPRPAHWRLSWEQRVTRNVRPPDAPKLFVTLHGLPATFARSFCFDLLATA